MEATAGDFMFEQTFKNIDDVLWKEAGCSSELDYTEQTSWMLFLKYLDDLEREREQQAELKGKRYAYLLDEAHRWSSWAAPKNLAGEFDHRLRAHGRGPHRLRGHPRPNRTRQAAV